MTRKEFEEKAIREAEKTLHLPEGWWGNYRHLYGPGGIEVRFVSSSTSSTYWSARKNGKEVSRHDSRDGAIRKGVKL